MCMHRKMVKGEMMSVKNGSKNIKNMIPFFETQHASLFYCSWLLSVSKALGYLLRNTLYSTCMSMDQLQWCSRPCSGNNLIIKYCCKIS